jgi:hypothetical protein
LRGIAALLVAACLLGCGEQSASSALPAIIPLPVIERVGGPNVGCAGAAPEVIVRLDPTVDPPAWFELAGQRLDVRWPPGFRLVTDPLVVIDARGAIVLRNGEVREVEVCAGADGAVNFSSAP